MGKGRKRGPKSGDGVLLPAANDGKAARGSSHGSADVEQVKLFGHMLSNAVKSNVVDFGAAPFSHYHTEATLHGASSTSSVPCRYFRLGYCWNGDSCRFQHSEGPITAPPNPFFPNARFQHSEGPSTAQNSRFKHWEGAPLNPIPKVLSKKERAPEECLDWYLRGSCPRFRTCRYAHPFDMKEEEARLGNGTASVGKGYSGFDFLDDIDGRDLGGSKGRKCGGDNNMGSRMRNGGFTDDDVYELALQGIKPWDPEAGAALAVLNGWDMDGGFGYDYDYGYDD